MLNGSTGSGYSALEQALLNLKLGQKISNAQKSIVLSADATKLTSTGILDMGNNYIINVKDPVNNTDAANKEYVLAQFSGSTTNKIISNNGQVQMVANSTQLDANANINLSNKKIINLSDPTNNTDAANKEYVDVGDSATLVSSQQYTNSQLSKQNQIISLDSSTYMRAQNGSVITNKPINMQQNLINNMVDPINAQDGATKNYVDAKQININSTSGLLPLTRIDYTTSANGDLNINNHKILNLSYPTNSTDASNKQYVDTQDQQTLQQAKTYTNNYIPTKIQDPTQNSQMVCGSLAGGGLVPEMQISQISGSNPCNLNINLGTIRRMGDGLVSTDGATLNNITTALKNYSTDKLISGTAKVQIYQGNYPALNSNDPTIYLNKFQTIQSISMQNQTIYDLLDPAYPQQASTKNYTDNQDNQRYLNTTTLNNITLANGDINANSHKITNVTVPTDLNSATTLSNRLDQFAKPSSLLSYSTTLVPTLANQIVNKQYVDTAVSGLNSAQIQSTSANTRVAVQDLGNLTTFTNNTINTLNIDTTSIRPQLPIDMGGALKILGLANPTLNTDAVNLQYLNSIVQSSTQTNASPIGQITAFYSNTIPNGWLLCDGSTFQQTTYPDLYIFLGNSNITPNLKGYFLRSLESSNTPIVETQANRLLGSIQQDSLVTHTHQILRKSNADAGSYDNNNAHATESSACTTDRTDLGFTYFQTGATGTSETRPKNIAVNYIIRALNYQQLVQTTNAVTALQTISTLTSVSVDDSNNIILKGNNSGITQQLILIRPYTITPTLPEIVSKSLIFTNTSTGTPFYLFESSVNYLKTSFTPTYNNGINSSSLLLSDTTTSVNICSFIHNSTSQTASNLKIKEGILQISMNNTGTQSTSSFNLNGLLTYDSVTAQNYLAMTSNGFSIPCVNYIYAYYQQKINPSFTNGIAYVNSSGVLTSSSNITVDVTGTILSVSSGGAIQCDTISLISGSANNYISVNGSLNLQTTTRQLNYNNFGYLNQSGSGVTTGNSNNNLISLYATQRIVCATEFNATSSQKIKDIQCDFDYQTAIQKFQQLKFYNYQYKDKTRYCQENYGIIAEQLQKIFPTWVIDDFAYIPNIMKQFTVGVYNIQDDCLKNGKVKTYTMCGEERIINYINRCLIIQSDCFVYGSWEVCPTVSKQQLFELTSAIVQKHEIQIQILNEKISNILLQIQK